MDELGKKVFDYRVKHGLTQTQMAQKCGLTRPTICALESETRYSRPNFMTIRKVNKILAEDEMEEKEND